MENAVEAMTAGHLDAESDDDDERPRKRRRGGDVGRDWKCEEEGCTKDFKSVSFSCATVVTSCANQTLIPPSNMAEKGSQNSSHHHASWPTRFRLRTNRLR